MRRISGAKNRKLTLSSNAYNIIGLLLDSKISGDAIKMYLFIYMHDDDEIITDEEFITILGFENSETIEKLRNELIDNQFLVVEIVEGGKLSYKITNFKKIKIFPHKECSINNINNIYIKERYKKEKEFQKSDNSSSEKTSLSEARIIAQDLYKLYPARCPNSGRKISKTSKDKEKIVKLVREKGEKVMWNIFSGYVTECVQEGVWFKNLSTFLNNLPCEEDYENATHLSEIFNTQKILEKDDIIKIIEELEEKECIFVIECSPKGRIIGDREKLLSPKLILKRMKEDEKHYKFVRRDIQK